MSFLNKITARIPFGKREEVLEYFFALNISSEKLTAALWTIEGKKLKILDTTSQDYSSLEDLTSITDKLLDQVVGDRDVEVNKILFGVPSSWLSEENLKDEYLKILRELVKALELAPMAYVESSRALGHFLEKQDGIPATAILVGFEQHHLIVSVLRAGKLDGTRIVTRGENLGAGIEKALLTFTAVETLPSKILIYGHKIDGLKDELLSFSWMSKLSFLHFPKIEILDEEIGIKSICLAGASEINEDANLEEDAKSQTGKKTSVISADHTQIEEDKVDEEVDIGFVVGDVSQKKEAEVVVQQEEADHDELVMPEETSLAEMEDFEQDVTPPVSAPPATAGYKDRYLSLGKYLPGSFKNITFLAAVILGLLLLIGAYLFLPTANIKIFVEPKILEKDTQVTSDPNQKSVNEDAKIIPGQLVQTEVSGSKKDSTTGKKQIGDPSHGTVIIYNKTTESKSISKGTSLASSNGLKFTLDVSVNIASQSATDSGITYGKASANVTASAVGADGNLPSGSELTVGNFPSSQVSAKAEGNFSGGTSREVTVVSDEDQKKLLASLTSDLRKQAQQKLQDKYPQMKILEEALNEEIVKKSFSKNVNDQASEFSLNLTVNYKGTGFEDKDLKLIVSKLVNTQVPEGFQLNLEDTETQADVSKLEKDGKLIFLARFKAKLIPKIDTEKIKQQIKGKSVAKAQEMIKKMDNVLGSEIKTSPSLPAFLQRIPPLSQKIKIEVGLK